MAKKKTITSETDTAYFLKVLMYVVIGSIWVKINGRVVLPLGLILGVIFASHEHFRIDRKMEYVVLIFAAVLGLAGYGIFIGFAV